MSDPAFCAGGCGKPVFKGTQYAFGHAGRAGCDWVSPTRGRSFKLQRSVDHASRSSAGRVLSFDDALTLLDAQIATVEPQLAVMTEARIEACELETGLADRLEALHKARTALLEVQGLDGDAGVSVG